MNNILDVALKDDQVVIIYHKDKLKEKEKLSIWGGRVIIQGDLIILIGAMDLQWV